MTNPLVENRVRFGAFPVLWTGLLVLICFLAVTVWPSLYRHDRVEINGKTHTIRMHRLSGKTEAFSSQGWFEIRSSAKNKTKPTQVPSDELAKLTGRLSISDWGKIDADIYNGTSRNLKTVIVWISVCDDNGNELHHNKYELHCSYGARPLASSSFQGMCEFSVGKYQTKDWRILSATWE